MMSLFLAIRESGMLKPLVRSNNDDRRQWRKQGGAVGGRGQQDASKALRMLGAATRAVARRRRDGEVIP